MYAVQSSSFFNIKIPQFTENRLRLKKWSTIKINKTEGTFLSNAAWQRETVGRFV